MPPVIKGEEAAEGEGRACGAEPPPETARHREEREAAWLAPPSSLPPPNPPSFSWTLLSGCRCCFSSVLIPSL